MRDGLCSLLEHLGHRTKSYRYPEVALQELIAAATPPEVVIVDYNMPGMNGAQFIGGYSTAVAKDTRFDETSILLMSGLPPSHFQDFMSEFAQLKLGHPGKAVQPGDAAAEAGQYPGHAQAVQAV